MFGQHFFENSERFPGGSLRFFALWAIEKGEKSNAHAAPEITNLKNHKEETQMKNELKLISMDTVETENVQWLWYP